jgi:glycosyltransferase involved in cell wall biosynthesis
MQNLTGVVVNYDTKELLKKALDSIWSFYPELKVIVIDGSTEDYLIDDDRLRYVKFDFNIGHGRGMDIGINLATTRHVLLFDSDIMMYKPPIEKMMAMMEKDTVAVGWILPVTQENYDIEIGDDSDIPVIAPFFHIVDRYNYWKFLPYVQSGGPTCLTSIDIYSKGLSDKVLKNIFIKDYVRHDGQGTVKLFELNPSGGEKVSLFPDEVRPHDYFKKRKKKSIPRESCLLFYDFKNDVNLKFKSEEEVFEFYARNYL